MEITKAKIKILRGSLVQGGQTFLPGNTAQVDNETLSFLLKKSPKGVGPGLHFEVLTQDDPGEKIEKKEEITSDTPVNWESFESLDVEKIQALKDIGLDSVEKLDKASITAITKAKGIGEATAKKIKKELSKEG